MENPNIEKVADIEIVFTRRPLQMLQCYIQRCPIDSSENVALVTKKSLA